MDTKIYPYIYYKNIGMIENKIYLAQESSDENNSMKKMLDLIGNNKHVVDFGCANGYFAHLMSLKQCVITGIEINPEAAKIAEQYCQEVIVADLDFISIKEILPDRQFDIAVFGDVLEHLRNPWQVLRDTKHILKEGGYIVASIPNIAHGAIRLALLQGRFEYTEFGILDNTHLRFFTRKTVEDLLENSGYLLKDIEKTKVPIFTENTLVPQVNVNSFDCEVINQMTKDEDIDTLQFIVRAFPCSDSERHAALQDRYGKMLKESQQSHSELQQNHQALEQSHSELQRNHQALERSHSDLQQAIRQANVTIEWMETSKFWKLRLAWFKVRKKLKFSSHHPATLLHEITSVIEHIAPDRSYFHWREKNVPSTADLQKLAQTVEILPHKPSISVIMPVFDTPESFLRDAIESVIGQIYPHWELCIADDASIKPHIRELLKSYQSKDDRIKVVFRETNGHISNCSNSALELATGDFVALLDHDDMLTPDALYEIALLVNRHPEADMIYSDEDKVDEQGEFKNPFFKPDWCPDSFLSRMYTCHLGVYRRALINEIGGFRPGFEGSQDYDLVLRFTEKTEQIFHIPKILYHWRIHRNSTASSIDSKSYAVTAAKKALEAALQRRGEIGQVIPTDCPGYHLIRYKIQEFKLVTIIIPTRDLGSVLDRCLTSIFEKTTYLNYEVLVIDNGSSEESTFAVFDRWREREPKRFRSQVLDIPFNYSTLNNHAVQKSEGDYLLFLNNDTEVLTTDWLEAMVEQVQRPQIGAVGVRLLYSDGTLQHAGVTAGLLGVAGHSHKHFPGDTPGYFNQIQTINNYSAVTAACLMCRRDVFLEVGGFEEDLAVAFNDVDFCFKVLTKGYRNIYLPHVKLYHHESKSRGFEDTPGKQKRFLQEVLYMQDKWKSIIASDPCYSPNLTKDREDYSINI